MGLGGMAPGVLICRPMGQWANDSRGVALAEGMQGGRHLGVQQGIHT